MQHTAADEKISLAVQHSEAAFVQHASPELLWSRWTAEAVRWRMGAAAERTPASGEANGTPAVTDTACSPAPAEAEHISAPPKVTCASAAAEAGFVFAAADVEKAAGRVARALLRGGWASCLTLGAEAAFLRKLRALLPAEFPLLAVETDMVRALRCVESAPEAALLADTSPWALLCLTLGQLPEPVMLCRAPTSATPASAASASVTQASAAPHVAALDMFRRLYAGLRSLPPMAAQEPNTREGDVCSLPDAREGSLCSSAESGEGGAASRGTAGEKRVFSLADISVGCIVHPEEPRLAEFFQHIPAGVGEVGIVWDGAAPVAVPHTAAPLRQMARPLAENFAAQRNAMLGLLHGRWVLYLDADERLSPQDWVRLPELLARMEAQGVGGLLLPRRTYEGREGQVRMAFGLWPDVQLRLFRRAQGVHFTGAVHERLEGLHGGMALAPDVTLRHFSHIWKDAAQLAARLKIFDAAGGAGLHHQLNAVYPSLPEDFFDALAMRQAGGLWRVTG